MQTYYVEYYMFELEQLEKDQRMFAEILKYDYMKIKDVETINEGMIDLVKKFFDWLIQKLRDMKNFIKNLFGKIFNTYDIKSKDVERKLNDVQQKAKRNLSSNPIILKNVEISHFNYVSFSHVVGGVIFNKCENIDKAQLILDFYQNSEANYDKIKLNVPKFVEIVKEEGYSAAISGNGTGPLVKIHFLNKSLHGENMSDSEVMKNTIYTAIYTMGNDYDEKSYKQYEIGDIKVDSKFVVGLKVDKSELDKQNAILKQSAKDNENCLEKTKKKIESIKNNMGTVREDIFVSFKQFSDSFVKLINYNKDMILWTSKIATNELMYIDKITGLIEKNMK